MLDFVEIAERNSHGKKQSYYKCDCGDVDIYIDTVVKNKRKEFCKKCNNKKQGKKKRSNLNGMTFGSWSVVDFDKVINRQTYWTCKCDCGNKHSVCGSSLIQGISTKCETCGKKSSSIKRSIFGDGSSDKHRIYRVWKNMKTRCYGSKNIKHYKNEGVTICDEWKNDFIAFRDWSYENGYTDSLEIDKDFICDELKISPKIYSPKTCIFIPKSVNTRYSALRDLVKKEAYRKEILDGIGFL